MEKNFSIEVNGKTYWVSRSMAVAGFVFSKYEGEWYVLANKRGDGAPDFKGFWNCPCGYLDYNETTKEACAREIYEETGVKIDPKKLYFEDYNDSISENRQNVTFRFTTFDKKGVLLCQYLNDSNSELDEVSDIKWIKVKNIDSYPWAFNHDNILKELINFYLK